MSNGKNAAASGAELVQRYWLGNPYPPLRAPSPAQAPVPKHLVSSLPVPGHPAPKSQT